MASYTEKLVSAHRAMAETRHLLTVTIQAVEDRSRAQDARLEALAQTLSDQATKLDALRRDIDDLTVAVAAHLGLGWRGRLRWLLRGGRIWGGR